MLIFFYFYLLLLIAKFNSKEFKLKKLSHENNEYNPYVFNFTLNNDTIIKYPSIFNTSQPYTLLYDENKTSDREECIKIENNQFCYFKTDNSDEVKGYYGIIGISNIRKEAHQKYNKNHSYYSYLSSLEKEEENEKVYDYINFVQSENDEAVMLFGSLHSHFKNSNSRTCQCGNKFWSCNVSSLKIGANEIYRTTSGNDVAIFSISEEYIILPKYVGNITLDYYKNKIKQLFDVDCYLGNDTLTNLTCVKYFNYEDLPDLSFVMKDGINILALSIDLFKILKNYSLVLKIKYSNSSEASDWYLGEPVIKNYNFLLNYTKENDAYLFITPSSLNGFILIIVACVGGFLFLFIFLTIIYCVSKNDKKMEKRRSYFSNWHFGKKNSDIFFSAKNSDIQEKVEEKEEEEDEKSESSENKSNKSDNKSGSKSDSDSKSGGKSNSDSKSSSSSDSENEKKNVEEKKLDDDEENQILNIENNVNNNIINNNLIINTSNSINTSIDLKDKFCINPNNKNNPMHVELSINNYDDEDNDEENELINKKKNK